MPSPPCRSWMQHEENLAWPNFVGASHKAKQVKLSWSGERSLSSHHASPDPLMFCYGLRSSAVTPKSHDDLGGFAITSLKLAGFLAQKRQKTGFWCNSFAEIPRQERAPLATWHSILESGRTWGLILYTRYEESPAAMAGVSNSSDHSLQMTVAMRLECEISIQLARKQFLWYPYNTRTLLSIPFKPQKKSWGVGAVDGGQFWKKWKLKQQQAFRFGGNMI